jgi:hypothetical protein
MTLRFDCCSWREHLLLVLSVAKVAKSKFRPIVLGIAKFVHTFTLASRYTHILEYFLRRRKVEYILTPNRRIPFLKLKLTCNTKIQDYSLDHGSEEIIPHVDRMHQWRHVYK